MIRDHLIISPNSPDHLVVRKGQWVYIPAQNEGGFQGKEIDEHTLGGAAAFKLTNQQNSDVANGKIREDAPIAQLYGLEADPYQRINVYNDYPEIIQEFQEILAHYRGETGSNKEIGWIDRRKR